ncbi:GIY-YIG nuclease family protein [Rheinheimera baltica]|uniref:RHS repeat-associated core domain-containing protein n=1 Tax=Rheinheimera baltica TaxID=67576 RepID=UPI0027401EEC|nr:RHS repeat-associated core domain-containing protein [Rheinheimera baltica]MDP5141377.1 GIY-YIG nuclease family protein [Rheinheimera baltica]
MSQSSSGQTHSFHYDGLGSTRLLSDAAGNVSDSYSYAAFGELLSSNGDTDNNYLFTGEQFDDSLDNYYLRARYYNPEVGRFTRQDEWLGRDGEPVTLNKYLYTHADPVNGTDPSGYQNLISAGIANSINTALAGGRAVNFRLFLREATNGALCLMLQEATEYAIGEAFSGVYIFEDSNEKKPYVGRSGNYRKRKSQHDALNRIKREIAKVEVVIDNVYKKFGFSDKTKSAVNQLRLVEQWFIEYIKYDNTANARREVADSPRSINSKQLRKLLKGNIDFCDDKVKL